MDLSDSKDWGGSWHWGWGRDVETGLTKTVQTMHIEDVKGELAPGQAVTTSSKCAQCNSAESAFPEMPQQDTVF